MPKEEGGGAGGKLSSGRRWPLVGGRWKVKGRLGAGLTQNHWSRKGREASMAQSSRRMNSKFSTCTKMLRKDGHCGELWPLWEPGGRPMGWSGSGNGS